MAEDKTPAPGKVDIKYDRPPNPTPEPPKPPEPAKSDVPPPASEPSRQPS